MLSRKSFILTITLGTALLSAYLFTLPDNLLHVVFCNVGQGDAIYIRTPSNQDMLIDGGPDDKVLACLGRYMPFYDREINIIMVSHPQKDHLQGVISVVDRYKVNYLLITPVGNDSDGYKRLIVSLKDKKIPARNLYRGDSFNFGKTSFSILWPDREWLAQNLEAELSSISLAQGSVLGISTSKDLNIYSFYVHLRHGEFDVLFTGDGDSRIQPEILSLADIPDVEVLKFPHHGSKYGVISEFLDKVLPELAVISAGRNPWGHPTEEAIEQLNSRAIKIARTDKDGDIEIVSDGQKWWVK